MKPRLNATLRYAVLIGMGLLMLYPLLWMIGGAFKPNQEIFSSIGFIPHEPTLEGFTKGWPRAPSTPSAPICSTPSRSSCRR